MHEQLRSTGPARRGWRMIAACLAVAAVWLSAVPRLLAAEDPAEAGFEDNRYAEIVFRNVNLVPMDSPRILPGYTVVVRNGRIALIGPADLVSEPASALVIDGEGRYLMPGLSDMHLYYASVPSMAARRNERMLALLLASGVTLTREMSGGMSILGLRDEVETGVVGGPHMIVAGPALQGPGPQDDGTVMGVVRTRHDGVDAVLAQADAGYQVVAVADSIQADGYLGILETAESMRMKVAGRVPNSIGLGQTLRSGQDSVELLDEVLEYVEADDSPAKDSESPIGRLFGVEHIDPAKMHSLLELAKASDAAWVPALTLNTNRWRSGDESAESRLLDRPGVDAMDPMIPPSWRQWSKAVRDASEAYGQAPPDIGSFAADFARRLHEAGVTLLLGTGSPHVYSVPGVSVHDELGLFVHEAGLSPYEAMRIATVNAAAWVNDPNWTGRIEIGRRADLVLVEQNPLEDIRNASRITGVLVGGLAGEHDGDSAAEFARWYDTAKLTERLGKYAETGWRTLPQPPTP